MFDALYDSPADAANMRVRADLMIRIREIIRRRRLTQQRAAKLFGVTQPRVSDVVRGKISLFSAESLIGMLTHAGMHVTISVKPAA